MYAKQIENHHKRLRYLFGIGEVTIASFWEGYERENAISGRQRSSDVRYYALTIEFRRLEPLIRSYTSFHYLIQLSTQDHLVNQVTLPHWKEKVYALERIHRILAVMENLLSEETPNSGKFSKELKEIFTTPSNGIPLPGHSFDEKFRFMAESMNVYPLSATRKSSITSESIIEGIVFNCPQRLSNGILVEKRYVFPVFQIERIEHIISIRFENILSCWRGICLESIEQIRPEEAGRARDGGTDQTIHDFMGRVGAEFLMDVHGEQYA